MTKKTHNPHLSACTHTNQRSWQPKELNFVNPRPSPTVLLKTLIVCVLIFVLKYNLIGQASFHIKYHIKFFNEKGKVLTCDSLFKDSIFICTLPGHLVKQEYDTLSNFFFIDIYTVLPEYTLIWKRNKKKMIFSIDCPTDKKDIYLDSLCFFPGYFILGNDWRSYVATEDINTRHLIFKDFLQLKNNPEFLLKTEDRIYNLKCLKN